MAFSYTSWPSEPLHPHAMNPPSSSGFSLNFQQQQQQEQQQLQQSSNSPSPRSLQGPRPPRLKVDKSSHAIKKKPPAGPTAIAARRAPPPPPLQPVIIYTVSPKIIRTQPSDFMALVQRLTGLNSSSTPFIPSPSLLPSPQDAPSPAARIAAFEKTQRLPDLRPLPNQLPEIHPITDNHYPVAYAGVLSPTPSLLPPPVSPYMFPPPDAGTSQDLNSMGFLQEMLTHMSPTGANAGGSLMPSPLGFSLTPTAPSPLWDFLLNSPQINNDPFGRFSDM